MIIPTLTTNPLDLGRALDRIALRRRARERRRLRLRLFRRRFLRLLRFA